MPINSDIALGVRVPQYVDPLEAAGKAIGLRNALARGVSERQEQQLRGEQIKSATLSNQATQRANEDEMALRGIVTETGGDLDKASQLASQRGVNPRVIIQLRKEADEHVTRLAQKKKAEFDALREQTGIIHDRLAAVAAEPDPVKQAPLWEQTTQELVQAGVMDARHAQPYPGPQGVQQQFAGAATAKQLIDAAEEKRKEAEAQRQADAAAQALLNAKTEGDMKARTLAGTSATGVTEEQRIQNEATKARDAATLAQHGITNRNEQQRISLEAQRLKMEKERNGFESSGGVSSAAQMAAEGKMDPQTVRSIIRRNPGIINQIRAVDPNFDEANIDNRYNTLKEFTSTSNGKAGGQALALNTLIHHADLYMQAADALKNGSFRPGNAIYNRIAEEFGSAPPGNAALIARFFASETGKVATGGVPAEGEINGVLKSLGTNASPEQIAGAGKALLQIAAGRATPLMERAKQAKIDTVIHVLGDDAKQILKKHGFDPETMKPATSTGGGLVPTHRFNPATGRIEEIK